MSPISGALDAFQWRVPVETAEPRDKDLLAQKIEELVKLGVGADAMLAGAAGNDQDDQSERQTNVADDRAEAQLPRATEQAVDVEAVEVQPVDPRPQDAAGSSTPKAARKSSATSPSSVYSASTAVARCLVTWCYTWRATPASHS